MIAKKSKRKDVNTGGVWQQNLGLHVWQPALCINIGECMIKVWWPVTRLINRRLI